MNKDKDQIEEEQLRSKLHGKPEIFALHEMAVLLLKINTKLDRIIINTKVISENA
ncbi:MAG: hypothetical protein WBB37_10740 [bacterium]